ncbi:LysE family translocator [Thaumasiovibrio subtropicus]|uniref:LysE family translocator n=1 Tax=Thaumasiovibrio subtropicus TaxID=1891207 RepID=UPI000B361126|nr:LysE family translocator [Thaumasiovibrio subtropicus]
MTEIASLFTLFTVHFVALMSPGPDFALVVQNASRYGRSTGIMIAFGLSIGILLHSTFSLTGISLLVSNQPMLFNLLQLAGGSYLIWLGFGALMSLRQPRTQLPDGDKEQLLQSKKQAFTKGFTTNILNPKALVFFVSLVSTLVPADLSNGGKITAITVLWALSFSWFAFLAWVLTGKKMQHLLAKLVPYIDGACGALFTAVGGGLIWQTLS